MDVAVSNQFYGWVIALGGDAKIEKPKAVKEEMEKLLPEPIFLTAPVFTICPRTASTVVALTSGSIFRISDFATGVRLFKKPG